MEFADVGKHCNMQHCQQQDFLPFKCEFCRQIFCGHHRRPEDHNCKSEALEALDDNYVIICPICKTSLSMKGKAKLGITPEHLWNEHVETGECQRKSNERFQTTNAQGQASHCQARGCKKKLTEINRFKCRDCGMEFCMTHRFTDTHDCKPEVRDAEMVEKIKKSNKLFNWGSKKNIKVKGAGSGGQDSDNLTFWQRLARLCICCGGSSDKDKQDKNKKVPKGGNYS